MQSQKIARLALVCFIFVLAVTLTFSQEDVTLRPPVIGFALAGRCDDIECPQNIKVLNPYDGSFIIIKEERLFAETLQFSPNAHFASYLVWDSLHIFDLIRQEKVESTKFSIEVGSHSWSPDGQMIAIQGRPWSIPRWDRNISYNPLNLYLLDLKTRELRQVTKHLNVAGYLNWSPDGSQLLFSAPESVDWFTGIETHDIYLLDLQSFDYTNITQSPGFNHSPSWSLDGTRFVHVAGAKKPYQLVIRDANAPYKITQTLTLDMRWIAGPRWVLDDEYIVFISNTSDGSIGYMINLASGELTSLARKSPLTGFDVSGDGENAVYMTVYPENRLCIIELRSLEEHCLEGEDPFFYERPVWGG